MDNRMREGRGLFKREQGKEKGGGIHEGNNFLQK